MRFKISYPGGSTHEVEFSGGTCVVGRDPACDVVLNDTKCSRRHAVVEEGPEGLVVRDSGSANGIYVNDRKVERSPLRPGDVVRLGEVRLTLLAEIGETVVMAPDGVGLESIGGGGPIALDTAEQAARERPLDGPTDPFPPAPAPPTPAAPAPVAPPPAAPAARVPPARPTARPRSQPAARRAQSPRPATVTLLAALWAAFVPLAVAGTVATAARLHAGVVGWTAAAAVAVVLAGLGIAMALGLRAVAPWARHLQIASAAVGLLVCPFTLAAATVLLYMARPEVRQAFEGGDAGEPVPDSAEPTFTLSLVGMLLLGLAASAVVLLLF